MLKCLRANSGARRPWRVAVLFETWSFCKVFGGSSAINQKLFFGAVVEAVLGIREGLGS